jgi:hypothetical protein
MSVSGGRNDTVIDSRFYNNKTWGVILVPFLDSGPSCTGGSTTVIPGSCLFDEWGDALLNNKFHNNGGYGNPTNGDFDQLNFTTSPTDCYRGNQDPQGLSPNSRTLENTYRKCTGKDVPANVNPPFLNEVLCDSQVSFPPFGCQPGDHYPRRTKVIMHRLPKHLSTMPDPCRGVPANPWCPPRGNERD